MPNKGRPKEDKEDKEDTDRKAVARAINDAAPATAPDPDNILRLSSGVVLKISPVPPGVIARIGRAVKRPEVPRQWIEEKGREEENPAHPDYLAALEHWQLAQMEALEDAVIALGSEIVSVPETFAGPDDDSWTEELSILGIDDIPKTGKARYLNWVRLWAVHSNLDLVNLTNMAVRQSRIPESEVTAAAESFPGGA